MQYSVGERPSLRRAYNVYYQLNVSVNIIFLCFHFTSFYQHSACHVCHFLAVFWLLICGVLVTGTGLRYRISSSLRSTTSEETSNQTTQYDSDETESDGRIVVENTQPDEKKKDFDFQLNEAPQEGSFVDSLQLFKFLEDIDIKVRLLLCI